MPILYRNSKKSFSQSKYNLSRMVSLLKTTTQYIEGIKISTLYHWFKKRPLIPLLLTHIFSAQRWVFLLMSLAHQLSSELSGIIKILKDLELHLLTLIVLSWLVSSKNWYPFYTTQCLSLKNFVITFISMEQNSCLHNLPPRRSQTHEEKNLNFIQWIPVSVVSACLEKWADTHEPPNESYPVKQYFGIFFFLLQGHCRG